MLEPRQVERCSWALLGVGCHRNSFIRGHPARLHYCREGRFDPSGVPGECWRERGCLLAGAKAKLSDSYKYNATEPSASSQTQDPSVETG
jgi:hypothetical protein